MDLGIKGKTALLAGASAGMGKAAAMAIAAEGAEVFMSARGEARLIAASQEIAQATGARIVPIVADHGSAAGRKRLLDACPTPDILVITCAPPRITDGFQDVSEAEWMESLATTLVGPVELMRQYLTGMAARGFGTSRQYWNRGGEESVRNPNSVRSCARRAVQLYGGDIQRTRQAQCGDQQRAARHVPYGDDPRTLRGMGEGQWHHL